MDYQEFMEEVDSKINSRMEDLDQEVKEYWEFRATHPYNELGADVPLDITSRMKRSIEDIEELKILYFRAYAAGTRLHSEVEAEADAAKKELEDVRGSYKKFLDDRAAFPEWAE